MIQVCSFQVFNIVCFCRSTKNNLQKPNLMLARQCFFFYLIHFWCCCCYSCSLSLCSIQYYYYYYFFEWICVCLCTLVWYMRLRLHLWIFVYLWTCKWRMNEPQIKTKSWTIWNKWKMCGTKWMHCIDLCSIRFTLLWICLCFNERRKKKLSTRKKKTLSEWMGWMGTKMWNRWQVNYFLILNNTWILLARFCLNWCCRWLLFFFFFFCQMKIKSDAISSVQFKA